MPRIDSAIVRFTFLRLWVSDADRNTLISSKAGARAADGLQDRHRPLQSPLVRDQHGRADLARQVDPGEHLGGVGELRDHVGTDEARDLHPVHTRAGEHVDQLDLARRSG